MATFQVTAPDGRVFEITAPEGATEQQVVEYAQQQFSTAPTQPQEPQQRSLGQEAIRQLGLTGRAAYEAITAPANIVLEAGRAAYNLGAEKMGFESRIPSIQAAQSQMLTEAGVPSPETGLERAIQAGAQGGFGAAGMAKALPKVPAVAADLFRQIPAAAASGLTAQPTAEAVYNATKSDLAAMLAGVGVGSFSAVGAGKLLKSVETGKQPLYTIDEIKQRAAQSYTKVEEAGITLKPLSVQGMLKNVDTALDDARMVPGTDQANEVMARLNQIRNMVGTTRVSFTELDKMRSMLNDLRLSKDADVRRLSNVAIGEVDNYINSLKPQDLITGKGGLDASIKIITEARKDWRNASRATVLDDALNTAEAKSLDPKASEGELIRRGFINIAANKNKMSLFSDKEQNIIKSVAKGGSTDKILSLISQFSPLRSKLAAAGGVYVYTQAPVTASAIAGSGLAADVLQGTLRQRAAQEAVKRIASGAVEGPPRNLSLTGLFSATQSLENPYAGFTE